MGRGQAKGKVMIDDRTVVVVDPSQVVYETLGGETLLIHLPSGTYFNLTGWGAPIWALLVEGHTLGEVRAAVAHRAGFTPEQRAQAEPVQSLVEQLVAESVLSLAVEAAAPAQDIGTSAAWELAPAAYSPPGLTRYEDMQHMLLLDPIHDATAAGWPAHDGSAF